MSIRRVSAGPGAAIPSCCASRSRAPTRDSRVGASFRYESSRTSELRIGPPCGYSFAGRAALQTPHPIRDTQVGIDVPEIMNTPRDIERP